MNDSIGKDRDEESRIEMKNLGEGKYRRRRKGQEEKKRT